MKLKSKTLLLSGLALALCFMVNAQKQNGFFNVNDFGAKGDGIAIDGRAINKAIDEAANAGGGTVYFPAGNYLSGSIHLKSNICLYIDQGATLIASTDSTEFDKPEKSVNDIYQDYGHSHWHNSFIWGENLHDVSIIGTGTIWGKGLVRSGRNGDVQPNKAISLLLCRNVIIRDISILHGGWFAILAAGVDNLTIDNLKVDTNRDGFDIDCCKNVRVSNCSVNSPFDDGICLKSSFGLGYAKSTENVTITNCQVSGYYEGTLLDGTFKRNYAAHSDHHPVGRIKFGTESNGGFNPYFAVALSCKTQWPSSGRVAYFYSYQLISRANVVLQKTAEVADGVYTTPNLKNYHEGEAYFLRGLAYFYLWNYFETSPLDTARITSSDQFTPPSTSGTQLLDQSISDFQIAAALLPASWDAGNKGRATQNSAKGMLGKALVFRASVAKSNTDYTDAITAFAKITSAGLTTNFEDNFNANTENNQESLFEYQATQAFGGNNVWLGNDFDNAVGNLSVFWGFYDNNYGLFGLSPFYAITKLLNSFDANDPCIQYTLNPADRTVKKYVTDNVPDQSGVGSVNNVRILRYADVLLLQAEAVLQSGGSTTEAIGLINQVRARARNMVAGRTEPSDYATTETDKTTVMNWIIKERLLELAGEGQRWIDLRRWQMEGIISLDNTYFSSNTSTMSFQLPKHLDLPIPNSETDVNSNVKQNQEY